jgi:hypothetical protein
MICLVILITYHKNICMFIIYLIKFKIRCVLKWYVSYSYCKSVLLCPFFLSSEKRVYEWNTVFLETIGTEGVIYKVTQGAKWKKTAGRQQQVRLAAAWAHGLRGGRWVDWLIGIGIPSGCGGPTGGRWNGAHSPGEGHLLLGAHASTPNSVPWRRGPCNGTDRMKRMQCKREARAVVHRPIPNPPLPKHKYIVVHNCWLSPKISVIFTFRKQI